MKMLSYILLSTAFLFFQKEIEKTENSVILYTKNISAKSTLKCAVDIEPKICIKEEPVQLTFTLENKSSSDLTIAKAIVGDELIWFRLRIEDEFGNIVNSGLENECITTDDLPALIFGRLQSKEKFSISKRLRIDFGFRMNSFDLKPGKYFISAIYRFEPEKEPYGAEFYKYESIHNELWTGIVSSKPIEIRIVDK